MEKSVALNFSSISQVLRKENLVDIVLLSSRHARWVLGGPLISKRWESAEKAEFYTQLPIIGQN